jgi:hypothetical protein
MTTIRITGQIDSAHRLTAKVPDDLPPLMEPVSIIRVALPRGGATPGRGPVPQ